MTSASAEQSPAAAKANIDAMTKHGNGTDKVVAVSKANAEAVTKGGHAAISGFQELAAAYQELAARNTEKVAASIKAITAVKSPAEFVELQKKLMTENIDAAANDWSNIAKLTLSVFTTTFEPVQKQAEAVRHMVKS